MISKNNFPNRIEKMRMKTLGKYEDLYDNDQQVVLPLHDLIRKQYNNIEDIVYLGHAIPAKISDFYGDFVQGDIDDMAFSLVDGTDEQQTVFDQITEDNDVVEKINDWGTEQSIDGFVVLLGYKGGDGKFYIQEVSQEQYFPQDDGSVVFATYFRDYIGGNPAVNDEEKRLLCYTQEYKLEGEDVIIKRQVWSTDADACVEDDLGEQALKNFFGEVAAEEKIEGLGMLPIVQIDNGRRTKWGFGKSDYADIMPQLGEINERRTHISTQLLKNLDAKLELPQVEELKQGDGSLAHFEYIMRPDNDTPQTRYITNENPLIEQTEKHITSQLQMISYITDVPMWALLEGAAPERVESMRIKLFGAIRKTTRKRTKLRRGLERMYKIGFKMLDKDMGDAKLLIEFSDVLPTDLFIDAQTEQIKAEAGLTSKRSAIRRLEGYDDDELDEEMERIKEEDIAFGSVNPNNPPIFA